jgi:cytidine deaminase
MKRPTTDPQLEASLRELARFARLARKNAHAPFSNFSVGAALKTFSGEIVTGCNIENATYGLTVCAERVAVFKAISEGIKKFEAIAIAAPSARPAAPCGACRQILWEFCGDIWIHMDALRGKTLTRRLAELLPLPFDRRNL